VKYNEELLQEIKAWLTGGKHANGTRPDCWVDESLEYCLALIAQLKDENESLWMMLEEFKNSKWTPHHSEELSKSIEQHLTLLKLMKLQKGEA